MKSNFPSLSMIPELQTQLTATADFYSNAALPPVFITLPLSVELEPLMDRLCDDLANTHSVRFTGTKRWLHMKLEYPEQEGFPSFALMMERLHKYAGYRNQYHGVVLIDLTPWLEHADDRRFSEVLAYLHDYADEMFFLTYITTNDSRRAEPMKREFNRWMYTVMVDVARPSVTYLTKKLTEQITEAGHSLTDSAKKLLRESVSRLAEQEDFTGMREINSLAIAICMSAVSRKRLDASHLTDFAPDGEWITQRIGQEKMTIGFTGGAANEKQ